MSAILTFVAADVDSQPLKDKHLKKFENYDIGGFNLEYFGICYKCQNKKPCLKK